MPPTILFRKARQGHFPSIDKLLRLDPLMRSEPYLRDAIAKFHISNRSGDYDTLLKAPVRSPKVGVSCYDLKISIAGIIAALAYVLNYRLSAREIRRLYDLIATATISYLGKEATLCDFCKNIVDDLWRNIAVGQMFKTPDLYIGKDFKIEEKNPDLLRILPQRVLLSKSAFTATIHFLRLNQHDKDSPCEIRSSNDKATAGPLCLAARNENEGVRCINYILPILQKNVVVGINPVRPNTTWLLRW